MPASLIGFLSVNVVVFWDNTLLPEGNLPLPAPLMFIRHQILTDYDESLEDSKESDVSGQTSEVTRIEGRTGSN
jgi:hypothetical protein